MMCINTYSKKKYSKKIGLAGFICGGILAGMVVVPDKTSAQAMPLNPCSGIYYEEPLNSNSGTAERCRSNMLTQFLQDESLPMPDEDQQLPLEEVSLPPVDSDPVAYIQPVDGVIDVQLNNTTNVGIYYQVTGAISRRLILPDEGMYLRNISLPATITTVRADEGLLSITSDASDADALLISLEEDSGLDEVQGVIQIQEDGEVFIY